MLYSQWLKDWIKIYKKPFVKNHKPIERCISLHIPKRILNKHLSELTPLDIQSALHSVPCSRMRVETFDIYHGSLSVAFKIGLIDKDISALLVKPKHVRKLGSALSRAELDRFLSAIQNHRLKNFFLFCLFTGCRRSESLSVTWNDFDFQNNLLHVRGTKTDLSDRYVPIFPELAQLIQNLPRSSETLFRHNPNYVSRSFKKLCPAHKLHDLRHTFATRCLECGISIKVVQRWLGHARLDTTASIYTHLQPDFVLAESKKFHVFEK